MQIPISQAMVHCDGKWELYKERRARYNSPSRPSRMGSSQSSKARRCSACAVFIPMALKCWMSLGLRAIHCYISLSAPYTTPTSHRNVPLLAKWEFLWCRRACTFSRDRRLALHVCHRRSAASKKSAQVCLADFSDFWFRLADERLCNW